MENLRFRKRLLEAASKSRQVKDEIWIACARDFEFFADAMLWTANQKDFADNPKRPLITWDYQIEGMETLERAIGKHDILGEKSRDMGFTWLVLAKIFHRWMFKKGQSFLVASRKESYVDETGNSDSLFWKALTLDTPILAPGGWVNNGDLRVGDFVIGRDGKPTKVSAIHDHGTKPVFRVEFSDGTSVRCCGDHQWLVTTNKDRCSGARFLRESCPQLVKSTAEMAADFLLMERRGRQRHNYQIPLSNTVEFAAAEEELPLAPYVIGVLLGDGSLSKPAVEFASVDQPVVERVQSLMPATTRITKTGKCSHILNGGYSGEIQSILARLGLRGKRAWEKFVPQRYLLAPAEDRLEVLRGIMDTDGWVQLKPGKRGDRSDVSFETTSPQLANDVAFLVRSLGGVANEPRSYARTYEYRGQKKIGRKAYRIGIVLPQNPFYLPRKASLYRQRKLRNKSIVGIAPAGEAPVRCITVDADDHLYVVDGFSVTHNCDYLLANLPTWMQPAFTRNAMHLGNDENGSTIDGESTNKDLGRGGRRTALMLDEFAAVDSAYAYKILNSTRDITNCRIFVSTPQGAAGAFYDQRTKMKAESPDRIIRWHWTQHPVKSQGLYYIDGKPRSPWYDEQCLRAAHTTEIAQELDIGYEESGYQFFEQVVLDRLIKQYSRDPIAEGELEYGRDLIGAFRKTGKGHLQLWLNLEDGKPPPGDYGIGCDIATGKAGEYSSQSVASIVDIKTGRKVGQFASNAIDEREFGRFCVALARYFHEARLIWEANGPGQAFGKSIFETTTYRKVWLRRDEKKLTADVKMVAGWWSDRDTKYELLAKYREALAQGRFINPCREALLECGQYVMQANRDVVHARSAATQDPTASGQLHGDQVIADACANLLLTCNPTEQPDTVPIETPQYCFKARFDRVRREQREGHFTFPRPAN